MLTQIHDQTELLRNQVLDLCWGHPDGCNCSECHAEACYQRAAAALSDAQMHLRVAAKDNRRWLVRYRRWLHGAWVACEERYFEQDYAVRRFEAVQFSEDCDGNSELMEVLNDRVCALPRNGLPAQALVAVVPLVPQLLRDGAGAGVPAGAVG